MSADKPVETVAGSTKYLKFTITDKDTGEAVDVSSCTAALTIETSAGVDYLTKADGDFDKSEGASGILKVLCAFATAGRYTGFLSVTVGLTTDVMKFGVEIERGVTS